MVCCFVSEIVSCLLLGLCDRKENTYIYIYIYTIYIYLKIQTRNQNCDVTTHDQLLVVFI